MAYALRPSSGKSIRSTRRFSPSRMRASVSAQFDLGSPMWMRGVHAATRTNPWAWMEWKAFISVGRKWTA